MTDNGSKKLCLYISIILFILLISFFTVTAFVSSSGYAQRTAAELSEKAEKVFREEGAPVLTLIIDPGHGGEDPGAVANGVSEKDLNLAISLKLRDFLALSDCNVVMSRTDDRLLYAEGESGRKKFYDLRNRLALSEEYPNSVFISIHQNKFPVEKYSGLQVFYSLKNNGGKELADLIQQCSRLVQPTNSRQTKPGTNIFILENIEAPAVIVECGFISNPEEAASLCDSDYTDRLACAVCFGILQYIGGIGVEG